MPFYNVSQYITRSLESLARQKWTDFEAILVDDGSDDESSDIAAGFARQDARFTVVRQDNAGPGPARNRGVALARGSYLGFADGDDEVPDGAYASMVRSLEDSGSDIACGQVMRFVGDGPSFPSDLHGDIGKVAETRTHISRNTSLVANRTVWNQMYRRTYWDAHAFSFEPVLYEDTVLSAQAHVRASAVDVVAELVYRWRMRAPHEPPSITSGFAQPTNVLARMKAAARVNSILRDEAPPAKPAHDALIVRRDLRAVLEGLPAANVEEHRQIISYVKKCVHTIAPGTVRELPAEDQERYSAVVKLVGAGGGTRCVGGTDKHG
jgi:CDP-glycerol glycerophosphotransferase